MPASDVLSVQKNRSTGNLLADVTKPPEGTRIRFSLDAGKPGEHDPMSRSPVMGERDHGLGVSGLRWIRQQPSRAPTLPPSPESSFTSPARSSSMTIDMSHSRTFTPGGPASPTFNFSEDLTRFPSESLHSFSFAQQSEDVLHSRQNVLRRTMDFVDSIGPSANPGLLHAQAKVSGDIEMQSMMELLARANVLGSELGVNRNVDRHGPLTGPAETEGTNVFERTFVPQSESPGHIEEMSLPTIPEPEGPDGQSPQSHAAIMKSSVADKLTEPRPSTSPTALETSSSSKGTQVPVARPGLKRTYTDTSSLSLHTKLMEALAKPYFAKDGPSENNLLSLTVPSFGKSLASSGNAAPSVHSHSHRWAPAAQAIFTTESQYPYTILAANDLACLVFGVTKAEVRKLGILEVVREDRREWLDEKLKSPGSEAAAKARSPTSKSRQSSPAAAKPSAMRGGITALLLSKPPSRSAGSRRAQTDDGYGSSLVKKSNAKAGNHHFNNKSRGVLLCGDVVPIVKRNGATGSATLWVKEKRSALIWVLEEIVEDKAFLTLDERGKVLIATGATETIWGASRKPDRLDIRRLLPHFPVANGEVDYDKVSQLEHFTARHEDGYNIPTSVTAKPALGELRVSSFPHIAGIVVLSSTNLEITSSNSVFSAALFGQPSPNGRPITELIPRFDSILNLIQDEENVKLVDGIVIPEYSFRRARALLALREGNTDAAAIFLRPTGLTAKHRDGSNISVDISMRVVKSETLVSEESVIEEASDSDLNSDEGLLVTTSKVVYALWITYSRHLHSLIHPGGPASPLISRPGTPPRQPSPGQSVNIIAPYIDSEDLQSTMSPTAIITKKIEEATMEPISSKPFAQPPMNITTSAPAVRESPRKKSINEYVVLEDMGQGAYGQVKLARCKKAPATKVVLKYVTKKRILMDCWYRGESSCGICVSCYADNNHRSSPRNSSIGNPCARLPPQGRPATPQHCRNDRLLRGQYQLLHRDGSAWSSWHGPIRLHRNAINNGRGRMQEHLPPSCRCVAPSPHKGLGST